VVVGASLGLVLGLAGTASSWAAGAATAPRWHVMQSVPRPRVEMSAVSSSGRRNAWAVADAAAGLYALHWDGSRWRHVGVPGWRGFQPFQVTAVAGGVWIVGQTANNQPEALIKDAGGWRALPLPASTVPYQVTVLSTSEAWGLTGIDTVWHWHDGIVSTYQVPGGTYLLPGGGLDITGAGRYVWILSNSGAIYAATNGGLEQIASPPGSLGIFPQIAASPRGQLWLLALLEATGHKPDKLDYWNGHAWTRSTVPFRSKRLSYGSWGFIFDDHNGVWLGPYTHWTGHRWVRTSPAAPTSALELMEVSAVPGSASAWAVGVGTPGRYDGVIAYYGSRP
jgi:hypothetical protein